MCTTSRFNGIQRTKTAFIHNFAEEVLPISSAWYAYFSQQNKELKTIEMMVMKQNHKTVHLYASKKSAAFNWSRNAFSQQNKWQLKFITCISGEGAETTNFK